MVQKGIVFIGSVISAAILFYFFRFLYKMSWLDNATIDYNIAPMDVINLIVTSVVTILIGWYIVKKLTEQRFAKEFLMKDLVSIEDEVRCIMDVFNTAGNVDLSAIAAKGSKVQMIKARFIKTISIFGISDIKTSTLDDVINEMFRVTTDFDSPNTNIDSINVQEINQKCNNVILETRNIIVAVNNY